MQTGYQAHDYNNVTGTDGNNSITIPSLVIRDPATREPLENSVAYGPVQPIGGRMGVIAATKTLTGRKWEPRGGFSMEL